MGVGAALVLVSLGVWFFFLRPQGESLIPEEENYAQEAVTGNVIDDEEAYSMILADNELDDLKKLLIELDNWKRDAPFAVRLDTLDRRIEVANAILKHKDTNDKMRVETARKLLSAYGQYYGISLEEGLTDDGEIVTRYINACNDYVDDVDADLAKFARISKAKVQIYEMTGTNNTGSAISIEQTIGDLVSRYPNDPEVMLTVRQLIARVREADFRASSKIARDLVARYDELQPTDKSVLAQLRAIKDQIILEDSQIALVSRDAQVSGDYDEYFKKIDELLSYKDTGIGFVNRIYESIRFFEGLERYDLALKVIEKLEATWSERTDPVAKQQAARMAKFGRIRNEIVGKKIDLTDTQSNGEPIQPELLEGKPCIIAFYSPNAPDTREMFKNLNFTYKLLFNTNVRVIAISVEPALGDPFIDSFDPTWISINSSVEKTSSIFRQCPVSHVPYFVVVRSDGVVDSIGVPAGKLKTKIETLAANAKISVVTGTNGR